MGGYEVKETDCRGVFHRYKVIVRNMFHLTRAINPPVPLFKGGTFFTGKRFSLGLRDYATSFDI